MPAVVAVRTRPRYEPLDGIRGVAIALVVLSHGWTLFPLDNLQSAAPMDGLFHAGDLAVTIFFVVSGFLVTRTLLRRSDSPNGLQPWRYYIERFVRIGVHIYPLVLAILVISYLDSSDPFSRSTTDRSLVTVSSYTWNWYLQNRASAARGDLGHLWYLSVQEQYYLGLIIVVAMFARFRARLIWGVLAALILVTIWRFHTWDVEGAWRASLRTTTRCDGLLWGTFTALVVERLAPLRRFADRAFAGSLIVIGLLVFTSARFGDSYYFKWQGVLMSAAVAVFIVATYFSTETEGRCLKAVTWRPLMRLGGMSLAIYVWHYPLFWFIARHTIGWGWFARTTLATASLIAIVVLLQRYVDAPTARWLHRFSNRSRLSRSDDAAPQGTSLDVADADALGQPVSEPVAATAASPAAPTDPVDPLHDRAHPVI